MSGVLELISVAYLGAFFLYLGWLVFVRFVR